MESTTIMAPTPIIPTTSTSSSRNARTSNNAGSGYYSASTPSHANTSHHGQTSGGSGHASHSQSTSSRRRAAQQVTSSSSHRENQIENSAPTVTITSPNPTPNSQSQSHSQPHYTHRDVYSHPAAVQYMHQHPKRTIPKFGPYLLLQTLGEGEFGKVKLGLHGTYGEEVAVKLIRRAGVDGTVRMSKVEREIEVLKTLRHPNIVHLYDVIETDKYIGIIIEYASGGELFDHILAHRYLKEKDACKLFAQLISGVWYIHQKKIVHRDLKLENLLLDRNRNVIITDFGFANRFEHRSDDLMQTSCGSPCYAAPELVISEGLYVGSAVDIWSCGVILYAMLAGYLPFDDDPDNPDGDNINLLYKYIINTPLTFPDYVSAEARDLLGLMLVPDPSKRGDLRGIMSHTWLEPYRYLFERSVRDLEAVSAEAQRQKRLQYQKEMLRRVASSGGAQAVEMEKLPRSRSVAVEPTGSTSAAGTTVYDARPGRSAVKDREANRPPSSNRKPVASAMIVGTADDSIFGPAAASPRRPTALQQTASSPAPQSPTSQPRAKSSKEQERKRTPVRPSTPPQTRDSPSPATLAPPVAGPSTPVGSPSKNQVDRTDADTVRSKRTMRHTIQVEYEDQKPEPLILPSSHSAPISTLAPPPSAMTFPVGGDDPFMSIAIGVPGRDSTLSTNNGDIPVIEPSRIEISDSMPPTPTQATMGVFPSVPPGFLGEAVRERLDGPQNSRSKSPPPSSPLSPTVKEPRIRVNGSPVNGVLTGSSSGPSAARTTPVSSLSKATAPAGSPLVQSTTPPESKTKPQRQPTLDLDKTLPTPSAGEESSASATLGLGTSSSSKGKRRHIRGLSLDKLGLGSKSPTSATSPVNGKEPRSYSEHLPSPGLSKTPTSVSDNTDASGGQPTATEDEMAGKDGKDAKKKRRKTLSVMIDPIRNRTAKALKTRSVTVDSGSAPTEKSEKGSPVPPPTAPLPKPATPITPGFLSNVQRPLFKTPLSASTNKAQKVMHWFRGGRNRLASDGVMVVPPELSADDSQTPGTVTSSFQNSSGMESSSSINRSDVPVVITPATPQKPQPKQATSMAPSSWATKRSVSHNLAPYASNSPTHPPSNVDGYNLNAIRIHHGAVDQSTVTNGAPPEVFAHVAQVLFSMGVEVQREEEYKYRCVRPKRRKEGSTLGLGIRDTGSSSGGLAVLAGSGSATMNGVDNRGLPTSSSTGMFKNLLLRRHSSRQSALSPDRSPEPPSVALAGATTADPVYGDKNADQGDEVRFSVELTRIDGLEATFSLDIRRLKGNLRSYKFLYDTLRDRCNFSG